MDGEDLDPPAYGYLDDDDDDDYYYYDDDLMEEDVEDDQSVSDESVDGEKDYPYLNPPPYGYPDDGERPPFVLIEPNAYFANRDNATTASCKIRDLGGTFKVTFCTAHPPLVSYLCVHATAFDHTEFAVEPHIIATETNGSLILLRFVIGRDPSDMMSIARRQYFIYDASVPSLKHLPHPGFHIFSEHAVAIVRKCNKRSQGSRNDHHYSGGFILRPHGSSQEDHNCSNSNCDYVLAAHSGFCQQSSELCLYQSDTETWSMLPVVLKSYTRTSHRTSKTLTIGGDKGTVAWVDLSRNILLCDVLDKNPNLRSLELPPPILPTDAQDLGTPRSVRDIALLGSFIKYVDLQPFPLSSTSHAWKAAIWSIKTGSSSPKDWHMDYLLDSTEIPESSLPKLRVEEDSAQPTLSTLHIGLPLLSLLDDGIVYFLTKIDYRSISHVAWVLAVDMRNKTVQKVAEFSSRRTVGLALGYIASRISNYLKGAPGAKQNMKRPGISILRSSSKKHLGNCMVINLGGP
ncbi:uncharacterized protein [Lolium perenne]|uniref:uncharacterized protein n=1 Tax=Lolium perenne TaxID=4522 RepID=UPI0021F5F3F6|nr:uncharacterized protein LOC127302703 [Lolium perenne]